MKHSIFIIARLRMTGISHHLSAMIISLPILMGGCISPTSAPVLTLPPISPQTPILQSTPEQDERQALVALYQATNGESWSKSDGWLSDQPICTWYGVTCIEGWVVGLDLSTNELQGKLAPEIRQLFNLQTLSLWGNRLTEVPPEIGQFVNLQELDLENNQLPELPPEIGQLAGLQVLSLGGNQLTELPPEIGQLRNLQILYLSDNQLTKLPSEIGQLTNLLVLDLRDNQLTELSPEIGQLPSLQVLALDNNRLTKLPPESGQLMNSLQWLGLSGNLPDAVPLGLCRVAHDEALDRLCYPFGHGE